MEQLRPGTLVSPHFSWAEATVTQHRGFLVEQSNPPAEIRANLVRLAFDVLEPARALVGPLFVSSAYRCPQLNTAVGGAKASAHTEGRAADVVPVELELRDAYRRIAESAIPYDQLIFEFGRWIHIAAPRHSVEARRQHLMIFAPGEYLAWAPSDPRFRGTEEIA